MQYTYMCVCALIVHDGAVWNFRAHKVSIHVNFVDKMISLALKLWNVPSGHGIYEYALLKNSI